MKDTVKFDESYLLFLQKNGYTHITDRGDKSYAIAELLKGKLPFECTQPTGIYAQQ